MTYRRVLVPILGNSSDHQAIDLAVSVVDRFGAELNLVYVVEVGQAYPLDATLPREVEAAERALEAATTYARSVLNGTKPALHAELLQARAAGPAIVDEAAEHRADVIVMALRNQRRHGRATVGDTVPYILKNAPCEVIIRRQPARSGYDRCNWSPAVENSQ